MRENKLNDLTSKEWIKFQKSWFILNPRPRKKNERLHPAKFPEELIADFISFFTKRGQWVLDPMAGTGSTVIAAVEAERNAVGIELVPEFAEIATARLGATENNGTEGRIILGDARNIDRMELPLFDYVITSPPYWDMLHRGGKFRKERGNSSEEKPVYSSDPQDVGNIPDYELFLNELVGIYRKVADVMRPGAYITVIVKNIKKGGRMYPLAWDLGRRLSEFLLLKDERIWCQDNQRLAPYGMFNAWVSNTFHHYCINLRKER